MVYQDVDDYINQAPVDTQAMAQQLRQIIKKTVPKVTEKLSYGMPYYSYHGRLVYFGAYKNYVGLYVMFDSRQALENEIKPYQSSKATLHFPVEKPLPIQLIRKIIKIQARANETR